ncbi:hypothetical protein ACRALDRAFT_1048363 [Sodiomyces alcalophilus JCM 7366]|uniref:uncharacterized protein n=1 Tax=Sodiomyces alcalophilus JCM 7366 TaxID=591952 RepID=UPI0039B3A5C2
MPMTHLSSLRALNRARVSVRLLPTKTGHLNLVSQTSLRTTRPWIVTVTLHPHHVRPQSTSNKPQDSSGKPNIKHAPLPTPWQLLRRSLSFRGILSSLTPSGIKKLYRQSPLELVSALAILAGLVAISAYIVNVCVNYFFAPQFTRYPPVIAKSLRRALYYTNMQPEPQLARKWYKKALEQCDELGLDPFSDEVLGIRIQTAAWLEKIGNYQGAITILESVSKDCTKWISTMEEAMADGTVHKSGKVPPVKKDNDDDQDDDESVPENLWRKRNRLLAKAVGTNTKLGELYADDHVNDSDNAQARLTWAVETALSEARRRSTEGVKPEEGSWLSPEEFGGAMESLAKHYESKSQFHLAVPLYFQALRLCQSPCHRSTIMNNLAASFAQHPVLGSSEPIPHAPAIANAINASGMPTTREGFLEAAWNWARNAKNHAKDVESSERTPECDEACAVALSNMGDIAAMQGKVAEARRRFQQCIELSRKIDFGQGIKQAEAGLRNLQATSDA